MKQLHESQLAKLDELAQDAMVDLFELDLMQFGGEYYCLCNQINELREPIIWKGVSYMPYPIKADGFELRTQGASNRPTLTVSNIHGLVTAMVEQFQGGVGAKVTRRQVYATHLDEVNFANGNAQADPLAEAVSLFVIENYKSLNAQTATFELAIPSEADGVKLPRRIIISNSSPSAYKKSSGILAYKNHD